MDGSELDGENSKASDGKNLVKMPGAQDGRLTPFLARF